MGFLGKSTTSNLSLYTTKYIKKKSAPIPNLKNSHLLLLIEVEVTTHGSRGLIIAALPPTRALMTITEISNSGEIWKLNDARASIIGNFWAVRVKKSKCGGKFDTVFKNQRHSGANPSFIIIPIAKRIGLLQ